MFSDELTQHAALRWLDHAAIRRVLRAISGAPTVKEDSESVRWVNEVGAKYSFETNPDHGVQTICQSCVDLYKRREQADYYRPGEIDTSESSARDNLDSAKRCCHLVVDASGSADFYLMVTGMLRESIGGRAR